MSRRLSLLFTLFVPCVGCGSGSWYGSYSKNVTAHPTCKTSSGDVYVLEEQTTFQKARELCVARDARIVSILSQEENDRVSSICGKRSCWIGLDKLSVNSMAEDWRWLDGTTVKYVNWAEGEPYNADGSSGASAFMNLCQGVDYIRRLGHGGGSHSSGSSGSSVSYYEDEEDMSKEEGRGGPASILGLLIFCGCTLGPPFGELLAFGYAVMARNEMLPKAKAGQPVEQPSPFWRYCCGNAAIYYWEGCSTNYVLVLCLWPWFAICCWTPTPMPMEHGMMVGQAVQVGKSGGYGQTVVGSVQNRK